MHARLRTMLVSIPRQKKRVPLQESAGLQIEVAPTYVGPAESCFGGPWELGPADAQFAKGLRPNILELLVVVPCQLVPSRFVTALQRALLDFPCIAGRRARNGTAITAGPGVKFSALRVADDVLYSKPPADCLFDVPGFEADGTAEIFTLRIAMGLSGKSSSIGVCFDHAMCDISGTGLLLAHLSAHYAGDPMPAFPHHSREEQALIRKKQVIGSQRDAPGNSGDASSKADHRISTWWKKVEGGCVCVEWNYTAAELRALKVRCQARSRHDAVFTDVLVLLHEAGYGPLHTVSLSRDERSRAGLSATHFGNGAVFIQAKLPEFAETADAVAIAAGLRAGVDADAPSGDEHSESARAAADVHFNTWWHALQHPLNFAASDDATHFAIGPGTLASAVGLCAMSGGKPTVTVLPAVAGGLVVSLLAPLKLGHALLKSLRLRAKEAKAASKTLSQSCTPTGGAESSPVIEQPSVGCAGYTTTCMEMPPAGLAADNQKDGLKCALLWLHGLGDSGSSWEVKLKKTRLLEICGSLQLHLPTAKVQHVTAHQEPRASWFDVCTLPIDLTEPQDPEGMQETVQLIHSMIDELLCDGMLPEHIFLGGFSQGGAASILAGLTYRNRLGGIISISGWCVCRDELPVRVPIENRQVPMFFSCGRADPTVTFQLSKQSGDILTELLKDKVSVMHIQRNKHWAKGSEMEAAIKFILDRLPGKSAGK